MQRLRAIIYLLVKWLRWPVIVVLALNIERLAEEIGWDKVLAESSGSLMSDIFAVIQSGWFQFPAVFMVGLWLALWLETRVKAVQAGQIASTELPQQKFANDQEHDPWISPGTETFLDLTVDLENWKAEVKEQNNIYKYYIHLIDEENGQIEATILFDKFIPSPSISITCDNKQPGYKTAIRDTSDRHVKCELFGVQFPCAVRFESK